LGKFFGGGGLHLELAEPIFISIVVELEQNILLSILILNDGMLHVFEGKQVRLEAVVPINSHW